MRNTMDELAVGQKGSVKAINAPKQLKRRLMDMGFTKGVGVEVVKMAPMGDPMEISVRGYHLCLRKAEARSIELV
ncbi:MAG: ferrous iron transport protein A [Sphaerochaeta sp.]|jgi:ferrous iron transport protein A|nr:MAG: ferrous iron transport protein A [Sphaerochaeta sp.]HOR80399.1 ferrous iron transport protein A [Sphaerochaeta sp.]HPY45590.1 ferrous iron transport protein A [Sphaerochaeta sp.]HQB05221.1 ferrous iron transport protein A [Sphaerochaeta sp.]